MVDLKVHWIILQHNLLPSILLWQQRMWTMTCFLPFHSVPWISRRSNQSILKEISPEYSLEGLILRLKIQYLGHLKWRTDLLEKTDSGKDWRQQEEGKTEDEMIGWHHWLTGHEFEEASGVGDGQGNLACCSPCGCRESDTNEQLN